MPLVLFEVTDGVGVVTLNRPEARNALNDPLLTELSSALLLANADPEVRAILLTGKGDKAFCAGADLGATFGSGAAASETGKSEAPLLGHDKRGHIAALFKQIRSLEKPVVAAANGAALAGGFGVLLACDLAVATETATFALPEIKRGLMPYMVMALLARHLGDKRALGLALLPETLTAQKAEAWGLVNAILPGPEPFLPQAVAWTSRLAAHSPVALALGKKAFYAQRDLGFAAAIDYLHSQLSLNAMTDDSKEGIAAFFEKREPKWQGR